ncbi:uncharacterized protein LOC110425493 [Herrania umbratica]|uniref:Uncharacterized protein LOC110425493 n=1 Tax=Herrania umbratica TaxID=108875 RepID=A0A6J1B9W1_9ROSI|nr:uncharacterized protein LOC110425493 [Herrania umbratica]
MAPTGTVSLKLLVESTDQRVLFAEAGKDFVDFLFSILSLPVGTVTGLLTKQDMVGCLGNLYVSLDNLSETYMQPTANKDTLLKPMVSNYTANVPPLLPNLQSSTSTVNCYRCANTSYSTCRTYIANDSKSICPNCNSLMSQKATFVNPPERAASSSDEGGYVKGVVTYMIMDDLVIRPMSTISCITLLNKFSVKDVGVLEEKVIDFGMDEGVKLLKASMQSKSVLTDVFLGKKVGQSEVTNPLAVYIRDLGNARRIANTPDIISNLGDLFTEATDLSLELQSLSTAATTKVSLKLLVDVRGQRVLFAEAGKDFVDFLFNRMSLPVGIVVRLLNKEGMVGSLGKLYESIEKLSDVYMQPFQDKDALLKSKVFTSAATSLPHLLPNIESLKDLKQKCFYRCINYCCSYIAEEQTATCPQCRNTMSGQVQILATEKKSSITSLSSSLTSTSSSEGEGGFVKGVVTYMVMDDLKVKPMSTISSIALLNRFNVKDVGALEEKTVKIGMDEAVKLLKASLQSKTVLTDVFFGKKGNVLHPF